MSLIINKLPSMEVTVKYEVIPGGNLKYHEGSAPDGTNTIEEKFFFRRPSWADTKIIMSVASKTDDMGRMILDPWKFLDVRIKTLLCDWSLKDEAGIKLPVTTDNIDKLHPSLLSHLSERLDALEVPNKV